MLTFVSRHGPCLRLVTTAKQACFIKLLPAPTMPSNYGGHGFMGAATECHHSNSPNNLECLANPCSLWRLKIKKENLSAGDIDPASNGV